MARVFEAMQKFGEIYANEEHYANNFLQFYNYSNHPDQTTTVPMMPGTVPGEVVERQETASVPARQMDITPGVSLDEQNGADEIQDPAVAFADPVAADYTSAAGEIADAEMTEAENYTATAAAAATENYVAEPAALASDDLTALMETEDDGAGFTTEACEVSGETNEQFTSLSTETASFDLAAGSVLELDDAYPDAAPVSAPQVAELLDQEPLEQVLDSAENLPGESPRTADFVFAANEVLADDATFESPELPTENVIAESAVPDSEITPDFSAFSTDGILDVSSPVLPDELLAEVAAVSSDEVLDVMPGNEFMGEPVAQAADVLTELPEMIEPVVPFVTLPEMAEPSVQCVADDLVLQEADAEIGQAAEIVSEGDDPGSLIPDFCQAPDPEVEFAAAFPPESSAVSNQVAEGGSPISEPAEQGNAEAAVISPIAATESESDTALVKPDSPAVVAINTGSPLLMTLPGSVRDEFRRLRSSLLLAAEAQQLQVLMVCSVAAGNGASFVSQNLSLLLAEFDKINVARFELSNGMSPQRDSQSVTADSFQLKLARTEKPNLREIGTADGMVTLNELLRTCDTRRMMERLRERFDFVLIDAPAITDNPDTALLASQVDGVILVAQQNETSCDALEAARTALQNAQAKILGVVLNRRR